MKTADEIGKDGTKRFFVDERVGCVAVRDRMHPKHEPEYPGLHFDTSDVIYYAHGHTIPGTWIVEAHELDMAHGICDHLNSIMSEAESRIDTLTSELEESKRQHKDAVLALANITDTLEELARELGEESQEETNG